MLKRLMVVTGLVALIACGDTTAPKKAAPKPDPYITIRLRDSIDTTTTMGRANWKLYVLISSADPGQAGTSFQGTWSIVDARVAGRFPRCMSVSADSIGQRFVAPFAIADTTHADFQPNAATDSIIARWVAGNHSASPGYAIFTITPVDAWNSVQYAAGHGLVQSDPIKWAWNWTGSGATFAERVATDTVGCNTFNAVQ